MSQAQSSQPKKLRVVGVSNGGGHWSELCALEESFAEHEVYYVTQERPWIGNSENVFFISGRLMGRFYHLKCFIFIFTSTFFFLKLWWKLRPDCIISTGAEIAIPAFWIGKLFGARTIYVESVTRCDAPSLSARLVVPVTDACFVQQESLVAWRPDHVRFAGSIL